MLAVVIVVVVAKSVRAAVIINKHSSILKIFEHLKKNKYGINSNSETLEERGTLFLLI